MCGFEFAGYEGLKRHIDAAHEGKKSFKCNVCDLNILGQVKLNNYMATNHGPSTSLASAENSEPITKAPSVARISESTLPKKIYKSIWLNETCQTTNCNRAHPPCCTNPDRLIIDQGLPKWKNLQCRSWHGHPKVKNFS